MATSTADGNVVPTSAVVHKIEELQRKRDARRRSAEAAKQQRVIAAASAAKYGGIENLEFLQNIQQYRRDAGCDARPQAWSSAGGDDSNADGGDGNAGHAERQTRHIWEAKNAGSSSSSSIRVCVRKRPMLSIESDRLDFDVVSPETHDAVTVHEPKTRVDLTKVIEHHRFGFDACFNEADSNRSVYKAALQPIVLEHVFGARGSATIFAYGQTGSGKTHTMAGHGDASVRDGNDVGLYALAADDVMRLADEKGLSVGISFFEVYRGMVLDLLGGCARLETMEDAKGHVAIVGLRECKVESAEMIMSLVDHAAKIRAVGSNSINEQSSRSHAILQVTLREPIPNQWPIVGRLSLVDLAGSERAADSASNDEQTRIEGAEINKSLLCLKECIRALDAGKEHVPFRGSKLTQVLKDSFIGHCKTVMVATISPGSSAAEDTLNTLRYAQRVRDFSFKRAPPKPIIVEAIAEAEAALDELEREHREGGLPASGEVSEGTSNALRSIINTVDSVEELCSDAPQGTDVERALYDDLLQADALHDLGYADAQDFARANDAVKRAKGLVYSRLRLRLDAFKSGRKGGGGRGESAAAPPPETEVAVDVSEEGGGAAAEPAPAPAPAPAASSATADDGHGDANGAQKQPQWAASWWPFK